MTDADSFDTDITAVLSVPNGTLQLTDAGDVTVSNDGTDTITLVGTQEELATALANVQYQPDANDNGTVTLTVTATDTDLHGDSTALTTAATSDITITAVNDEPVLTEPVLMFPFLIRKVSGRMSHPPPRSPPPSMPSMMHRCSLVARRPKPLPSLLQRMMAQAPAVPR
ncbi:hypothetical protein [Cobetia sp. ICG0124]|uniref:hypothetical protein n=1 Tax=Cobetia sp. ICG0124 TaxID=2053669 RepID=UPI000FDC013C|nr:hypothetical protein [Cobetia sp. ICG0124]